MSSNKRNTTLRSEKKKKASMKKASRKHYLKTKVLLLNKRKIELMETEVKFNLPRQGRSEAQQHFSREILLDKFSVISDDYLARPTTLAARRDLYQVCYAIAALLLLDKDTLIDRRETFYIMPLSRFPGAVDFFSDKEIDPSVLAASPSVLVFRWFSSLDHSGWALLRPCIIAFGTLLATFKQGFQGVSVPDYALGAHNSSAFLTSMDSDKEANNSDDNTDRDD